MKSRGSNSVFQDPPCAIDRTPCLQIILDTRFVVAAEAGTLRPPIWERMLNSNMHIYTVLRSLAFGPDEGHAVILHLGIYASGLTRGVPLEVHRQATPQCFKVNHARKAFLFFFSPHHTLP